MQLLLLLGLLASAALVAGAGVTLPCTKTSATGLFGWCAQGRAEGEPGGARVPFKPPRVLFLGHLRHGARGEGLMGRAPAGGGVSQACLLAVLGGWPTFFLRPAPCAVRSA